MSNHLTDFVNTIRRNCDISDSQSVGLYSICGLALRLRDLYKWEKDLPPWIEKDSSQISGWIDQKEQLWETIAEDEFSPLPLLGKTYDCFDTIGINEALSPHDLFYGAGYAHSLKPAFFLCRIKKRQTIDNVAVLMLGKELARDLLTIPALHQDGCIIFRREAAKIFLWDQMAYLKKSGRPALLYALKHCGLPDARPKTRRKYLDAILDVQAQTYIYHEIGELKENVFRLDIWRKLISQFPQTPIELLARAVKDLLADTHPSGTLCQIIKKKNSAAIGFYAAFIDGIAKVLFPEIRSAFEHFESHSDWQKIEQARCKGLSTAKQYAQDMIALYQKGRERNDMAWTKNQIQKKLIDPHLR